ETECLIIGYPWRIKGVFGAKTAENSRKPVFGFRLSGGTGILQRSQSKNEAERSTNQKRQARRKNRIS
ncbi:TPA: hypothetical protein ACLAQF_001821, partial [Neisseria meningitidis]